MRNTVQAAPRAALCTACLGSAACWVCTGRGSLPTRDGQRVECTTCSGRGLCSGCRPVPVQRTRA